MNAPVQNPITGNEPVEDLSNPVQALSEFYNAFNGREFSLMEQNWIASPEASMSNPLGGIRRGWEEIKTVYQNIFVGTARVYVEYYDYTIAQGEGFFQAVGRERGYFEIGETCIDLKIRTSRTFVMQEGRYKQLHHHGSIEEPELLAHYQQGVLALKEA